MANSDELSWTDKRDALLRVIRFRPRFTVGIVLLGGFTAFLEGIGLSFIYPILEVAQAEEPITQAGGILGYFLDVYGWLGIPFRLEYLMAGVALAMTVRFLSSFFVAWLKAILQKHYEERLRSKAFTTALEAEVAYFDDRGANDILNAIITETRYSGRVIKQSVQALETLLLVGVYFAVMLYISPPMTAFAVVVLGSITGLLRYVIEPAYTVGSRVAQANERVQELVQAGTEGIRAVKLFGVDDRLIDRFERALEQYTIASIDLARNEAAVQNFYDLMAALALFALIYIGFVYSGLALGALGIFFLAMFRLAPLVSRLNSQVYGAEGNISHLVRTQAFIDELESRHERDGTQPIDRVDRIAFNEVTFGYDDEPVVNDLSFTVKRGEFVAFVGQSGAGKSTVISLLTRLYEPNTGEIRANGTSITKYSLGDWRERIAVVRQDPYLFDDTLWYNLTIGAPEASEDAVEEACRIARVSEFLEELPNGYDSQLGDDGVRLSGGQRQRVALARALLTDADFLLLDEATSDLDSSLEREVQAAIESMDREYGILAVAHRLSTVKNADRIYTLADGEIVEVGSHEELMASDGPYAELYALQSR